MDIKILTWRMQTFQFKKKMTKFNQLITSVIIKVVKITKRITYILLQNVHNIYQKIESVLKHYINIDDVTFEQSGTTVNDLLEMVAAYCLRFGDSPKGRSMLIEMLKICAGPKFKNFNLPNYKLSKTFDPPPNTISYHIYCNKCLKKVVHSSSKQKIKGQKSICEKCKSEFMIKLNNPNYFLINNLEYQLRTLFENKEILPHFIDNSTKETCQIDTIGDYSIYK